MDTKELTPEEEVLSKFNELLELLKARKYNDRSEEDRYWAISITLTEEAYALFRTFVA